MFADEAPEDAVLADEAAEDAAEEPDALAEPEDEEDAEAAEDSADGAVDAAADVADVDASEDAAADADVAADDAATDSADAFPAFASGREHPLMYAEPKPSAKPSSSASMPTRNTFRMFEELFMAPNYTLLRPRSAANPNRYQPATSIPARTPRGRGPGGVCPDAAFCSPGKASAPLRMRLVLNVG